MPAEWERHKATWLSWPKDPLTFPPKIIGKVEQAYCIMVQALQGGEKVNVLVNDEKQEERVRKALAKNGATDANVVFRKIKSVDVWMRDYGPTFLLNRGTGGRGAVRWKFNAWGNKYEDLLADNFSGDAVASAAERESTEGMEIFRPGIVMEGGSIEVNGDGTVMTTEQCLLNRNRNPLLGKEQIENYLKDYLGVSQVVWLKEGIAGDDTDGHIDDFARFVAPDRALCASENNRKDENFAILDENYRTLKSVSLTDYAPLQVTRLPMPSPIIDPKENRRLPASYANFYIGNRAVLLPVFNDKNDEKALAVLQDCFPGREIVPIPCRELVYGYGGIHCVTQQEPE
jgi:agmatine deiminase